jgi:hypothetical protein
MALPTPPSLTHLPAALSVEGAVSIDIEEGIPIFRASQPVKDQIAALLDKQADIELATEEAFELDLYVEIDDYLSFVNRTIRNLYLTQPPHSA